MQKQNKKISTIIVTWNSKKFIDEALDSLIHSKIPTDIIVVDNDSSDGCEAYIKKKYPQIHTIQAGTNGGFGAGVNIGIKQAIKDKADYVFLLNPDAFIAADCIEKLFIEMEKNKHVGMASPIIYYAKPKNKIWFAGSTINWGKGLAAHVGDGEIDRGQYTSVTTTDRVCGCAVLIRTTYLQKVGTFDESYFLYYEETDLCIKFKQSGYKIIVVPPAKCWHSISSSTGGYFNPLYQYTHRQ